MSSINIKSQYKHTFPAINCQTSLLLLSSIVMLGHSKTRLVSGHHHSDLIGSGKTFSSQPKKSQSDTQKRSVFLLPLSDSVSTLLFHYSISLSL